MANTDSKGIDTIELIKKAFDQLPVGVEVFDKNGKQIHVNKKDRDIFGVEHENDMLGLNIFDDEAFCGEVRNRIHEEDKLSMWTTYKFENVRNLYKSTKSGEFRLYTRFGRVKDENNETEGYVMVNIDKDPNALVDGSRWGYKVDELLEAKEKAENADRMKSEYLANMTHEIRTPLNAIVGFSDVLNSGEFEVTPEERQVYLDAIHKNTDLLCRLMSDLLDFSQIETDLLVFHRDRFLVDGVCKEIGLEYQNAIPAGVTFQCECPESPVYLYTDRMRFKQIIKNILNNAIQNTQEGSIKVKFEVVGKDLRVSVTDTGIGIDPSMHQNIFERFFKVDNYKQGAGLGLAISKKLIDHMDGNIGVDSTLGNGAEFWFTVPMNK